MGGNFLHADFHHIVHSHTKAYLLNNTGRSGLKHHRRRVIGDLFTANIADHITAAHEGSHFSHAFRFDVNCARTAWTI